MISKKFLKHLRRKLRQLSTRKALCRQDFLLLCPASLEKLLLGQRRNVCARETSRSEADDPGCGLQLGSLLVTELVSHWAVGSNRQEDGAHGAVEGKETKAVEGVVLYGPVAGSTAYCQGASTNIPGPLATTEADTEPRTIEVSSETTEQLGRW